jgi:hypothetical protein
MSAHGSQPDLDALIMNNDAVKQKVAKATTNKSLLIFIVSPPLSPKEQA